MKLAADPADTACLANLTEAGTLQPCSDGSSACASASFSCSRLTSSSAAALAASASLDVAGADEAACLLPAAAASVVARVVTALHVHGVHRLLRRPAL